jgi:sulfur carrier protein ThiS
MKIHLVLYASLAQLLPAACTGNDCEVDIEEGATIAGVLSEMGIPLDSPKIVFLNGRHAGTDQPLSHGDRVAVFPPIAGG